MRRYLQGEALYVMNYHSKSTHHTIHSTVIAASDRQLQMENFNSIYKYIGKSNEGKNTHQHKIINTKFIWKHTHAETSVWRRMVKVIAATVPIKKKT